jgi:hypothetical protein
MYRRLYPLFSAAEQEMIIFGYADYATALIFSARIVCSVPVAF